MHPGRTGRAGRVDGLCLALLARPARAVTGCGDPPPPRQRPARRAERRLGLNRSQKAATRTESESESGDSATRVGLSQAPAEERGGPGPAANGQHTTGDALRAWPRWDSRSGPPPALRASSAPALWPDPGPGGRAMPGPARSPACSRMRRLGGAAAGSGAVLRKGAAGSGALAWSAR